MMNPIKRLLMALALAAAMTGRIAWAAPQIILDQLPANFVPGQSFSFDVKIAGAVDLASYNLVLDLDADAGIAGTDFLFQSVFQAASNYVFQPDDDLFLTTILPAVQKNRVSISDLLLSGSVSTVAGVNDRIATITVATTVNAGTIHLSLDTEALELDTPNLQPIAGFTSAIATAPDIHLSSTPAIPEPAGMMIYATGLLLITGVRRRGRNENA